MKFNIGDKYKFSKTITECDVYTFAGVCGDFNPLHIDKICASKSRFGRRICHGMLVNSFISTVIGMYLPGPGAIYLEQNSKFLAPVFIGDTIIAEVEIVTINDNGIINLNTNVRNQDDLIVIKGTATVLFENLNSENT